MWKKVKLLKMSNFTFFHNVFYVIFVIKSFNSHISVVVCSFSEFGTVSKWCIREWVKEKDKMLVTDISSPSPFPKMFSNGYFLGGVKIQRVEELGIVEPRCFARPRQVHSHVIVRRYCSVPNFSGT